MKHTFIAVIAVVSIAGVLAFLLFAPGVPKIIIDEDIDTEPGANVAVSELEYIVTLNFNDGSKKTFAERVLIGDLPLQSISADGKELTSIDADAYAIIKLPQNIDSSVSRTMYVESTASLMLNGQTVGGEHSTNTFWSFDQLRAGKVHLYHFSVPANSINLTTGTYALSLESREDLRFVVNGKNRIVNVSASPTFGIEKGENGILKELYIVSHSPAAVADLERDPITCCGGEEIRSYNSTIHIRAEGFKPLSDISFTYVDRSVRANPAPTHGDYSVLLGKGQAILTTDLLGNAVDSTFVDTGFRAPRSSNYYAHFIVSDSENYAFGMSGKSAYSDDGQEDRAFYSWPPCEGQGGSYIPLDCTIDMALIDQMIASGGGRYRA